MNNNLSFAILLLLVGICYIASTSIGIQCANANESYKKENTNNFNFLISQLVSGILVTLISFYFIYLAFTTPS